MPPDTPSHDTLASASRLLSLVLRHRPEHIGLDLDTNGWADIDTLIALAAPTHRMDRTLIGAVVAGNDK